MENNLLRGVVVFNKGGIEKLFSRVTIDASGNADVAFRSGAPRAQEREKDHGVQPVSLMFKVGPIETQPIKDYIMNHPDDFMMTSEGIQKLEGQTHIAINGFLNRIEKSIKNGELPLHRDHVLFFSANDPTEAVINMSRIAVVNPLDPWKLSEAELLGREQMFALMTFLQKHIPRFSKTHILAAGNRVGVRETRRIIGEYILTEEDVLNGRRFPDAVMRNA